MQLILILLAVAAIFAAVVLMPLVAVWAVNTLFAVGIAYTFKTWLASLILIMALGGSRLSVST